MNDNVMAKYATKSTKAEHYLQYDQGKPKVVSIGFSEGVGIVLFPL